MKGKTLLWVVGGLLVAWFLFRKGPGVASTAKPLPRRPKFNTRTEAGARKWAGWKVSAAGLADPDRFRVKSNTGLRAPLAG